MGDLGCFSFQESKLMTAGEGGIVITSNLEYYELLQSVVNCGRASLTDQYKKRVLGSNYRMTELQAALLIGQLDMLPELAAQARARRRRGSSAGAGRHRRRASAAAAAGDHARQPSTVTCSSIVPNAPA